MFGNTPPLPPPKSMKHEERGNLKQFKNLIPKGSEDKPQVQFIINVRFNVILPAVAIIRVVIFFFRNSNIR